ncbi:MAG TPA: ABC transporter substrate-binding protein [Candidatus Lustribacter sp.]|jgi:NitT/TauT family transport system substrate-binding protein|nr:ABC transporter substrate-binding protein [Candidatus Lustribacter sp.]
MTLPLLPHSRRRFIELGAIGAAFGLQTATATGQSPAALTPVRVSSAPDEDIMGTVWAQQNGIFAKYGLDVDLHPATSGAAVAASVVGGSIDVGKSSLFSLIAAHQKGIPIVLIAAAGIYTSDVGAVGLLVKTGSPIRTGKDLNGKMICVQALDDQFAVSVKAWTDQHGGDSSTLKFVEIPSSAAAAAIAEGRVDASAFTNPNLSEALATGKVESIAHPFDAIGHSFIQAAYFCTTAYVAANRPTVDRFVRAVGEAGAYVDSHPAQTAAALAAFTKIPLDVITHMARTKINAKLDAQNLQPVIDAAYKYKAISKDFDAKEMIAS